MSDDLDRDKEIDRLRKQNWLRLSRAYWSAVDLGIREIVLFIIDIRTNTGRKTAAALNFGLDEQEVWRIGHEDGTFAIVWSGSRQAAIVALSSLPPNRPADIMKAQLGRPLAGGECQQLVLGRHGMASARPIWPRQR